MAKMLSDEALDTIFRQARSQNAWTRRRDRQHLAARRLRPHQMGAHLGQLLARALRLSRLAKVEGAHQAASVREQREQGDEGAGLRHRRSPTPSSTRSFRKLFPHNPDARNWFTGNKPFAETSALPQRHAARRLFHHRGARARARLRTDVGLQQRSRRPRVLSRRQDSSPTSSAPSVTAIPRPSCPRSPRLSFEEACKIL